MIGLCQVLFIPDSVLINGEIPAHAVIDQIQTSRILLKASNSNHPGVFKRDAVSLSLDLAKLLIERGVLLIGVDGFSVENANANGEVHRVLQSEKVIVLETLDLSKVEPGNYELICLPLKIIGCDAAPVPARLTQSKEVISRFESFKKFPAQFTH